MEIDDSKENIDMDIDHSKDHRYKVEYMHHIASNIVISPRMDERDIFCAYSSPKLTYYKLND